MTLPADEFIRRFLIHTLPPGFQRIRYYGFMGNRHRTEKLALCHHLLLTPIADLLPEIPRTPLEKPVTPCPLTSRPTGRRTAHDAARQS